MNSYTDLKTACWQCGKLFQPYTWTTKERNITICPDCIVTLNRRRVVNGVLAEREREKA